LPRVAAEHSLLPSQQGQRLHSAKLQLTVSRHSREGAPCRQSARVPLDGRTRAHSRSHIRANCGELSVGAQPGGGSGPLFLTDRQAAAGTPTFDVCPETGRARLSYRRAEEIFEENTRLLANPLASPEDIEDLNGWTLHRLRHSALTHDAESGTFTPMLLARSRHASVRSLERYARPGAGRLGRPAPGLTTVGRESGTLRESAMLPRGAGALTAS
jgi:hypothetical protein